MDAKNIVAIVPGLMATSLVAHNLKLMKKPKTKNIVKMGMTNLVGVGMIGATAGIINKL